MFFGICNSPATFQAMMDSIFADMVKRKEILVYMDDILIFASTQEEMDRLMKEVLKHLCVNDLFLKPKKCKFNKKEIEYLGLIVTEGKLRMDPTKLDGIRKWPIPKSVKDVQSFLGFGNFYCKFIQGFSDLARPLNKLLKKNVKFKWKEEHNIAFALLKKQFTKEPVLMMPDHSKPFQIECDTLKYATGAILTQLDSNGDQHPISFIS